MDKKGLWAKTKEIFPILKQNLVCEAAVDTAELQEIARELSRKGVAEQIYETVLIEIDSKLRNKIVPRFWNHFVQNGDDKESDFHHFQTAVHELHVDYLEFQELLVRLQAFKTFARFKNVQQRDENEIEAFNDTLKVTLLSQLPANFERIVNSFYHTSFKVFVNSHQDVTDDDEVDLEEAKCNGCDSSSEQCRCQELVCAFNKTNQCLTDMSLLDRLSGFTLTTLIQERINLHVRETCEGISDQSHIENLENWLDTIVLNWLTRIFNGGSLKIPSNDNSVPTLIADFKVKLGYYLLETYANTIIEQFFNIIVDYPESQPAIDDLKLCLEKLDLRQHLVKSLTTSLETRLLHPGVNTSDILSGYIAAIKAIRHLDSSGVLLETITGLVKQYMRTRSDTVRCVVTQLTEEDGELAEELAKSEATCDDPASNIDEMADWESWNPDPVDIDPTKLNRTSRSADIISLVVDIYGSKKLFVTEYRQLLAERLLNQLDFDPEKEIRTLELLKLRFDESLLHTCEVMLKDISDSKRLNAFIHRETDYHDGDDENSFKMKAMVLSSQFWPDFKDETFDLPAKYQKQFEKYTEYFEAYKVNRTLNWQHLTGRVTIEVELANRTLEFTVNPAQAVILHYFQDRNQWTLDELCKEMKLQPTILRKRILFWQTQGIIAEPEPSVFVLVDDSSHVAEDMQGQECDDDETSSMRSANDQREEELQVFWSYIVGMLTNLDSLPLERIHQMLKMFASHAPGVEFSQEELKNFLQKKVREHKLIFSGNVYHLPK